jgi:glutamyl-tRNA synthetase
VTTGRFAPSPTGSLHLGNLRTALLAWCFARSAGGSFLLRVEDLTTGAAPTHEAEQRADLDALGLDRDLEVPRQSERGAAYDEVVERLVQRGLTYECFCSRREVREAAAAPHGPDAEGAYPGTCRDLTRAERRERERLTGRRPALRLRAERAEVTVTDVLRGPVSAVVDDFVLRRADGVAAYNLAVVVDDAAQGVDQVVRGDDLLATTPRQVLLQRLLDLPTPTYAHVPLVLGPDGERLAKRHGAVTLADRAAVGEPIGRTIGWMASSLRLASPGESLTATDVLGRFDPTLLPSSPTVLDARGST